MGTGEVRANLQTFRWTHFQKVQRVLWYWHFCTWRTSFCCWIQGHHLQLQFSSLMFCLQPESVSDLRRIFLSVKYDSKVRRAAAEQISKLIHGRTWIELQCDLHYYSDPIYFAVLNEEKITEVVLNELEKSFSDLKDVCLSLLRMMLEHKSTVLLKVVGNTRLLKSLIASTEDSWLFLTYEFLNSDLSSPANCASRYCQDLCTPVLQHGWIETLQLQTPVLCWTGLLSFLT